MDIIIYLLVHRSRGIVVFAHVVRRLEPYTTDRNLVLLGQVYPLGTGIRVRVRVI